MNNYLAILNANAIRDAEICKAPAFEADPLDDDSWTPAAEPMLIGLYHGTYHEAEAKAAAYMGTDLQNITIIDLNDPNDVASISREEQPAENPVDKSKQEFMW